MKPNTSNNDEHSKPIKFIELTWRDLNKKAFEQGYAKAKEEFKENMLMTKSNHLLGCMLECYEEVINNRIGFEKDARQLGEIASKLK